jgi:RHS repeat-associated protein
LPEESAGLERVEDISGSPNFWTDSHVLLSAWESVAAMRSGEMRRTALSRKPHPPPSDDAPAQPPRGDCREFLDLRVAGAMPTQNNRPVSPQPYDNNGNTTSKTDSTGTTNYTWDFENRLSSVTLPGTGGTVSFKYDPFGRRIYKSSSSGTSVYAYDGDNLVEETNATGGVVARYSQGLNIDEPLAMLRSATTSYYQADGLGSVTSLTNAAGTAAQNYTYDSFGNIIATTGSLVNSFRYTGREWDTETSLYYYRARYYDPQTGRFIGEDPLRFGASPDFYSYLDNDPTSWLDPSGLCKVDVRYTPVKRLGITLGYHATVIVADNTGGKSTPLFYRGQPSGDWWKPDTHLEALSGFDVPDPSLNPDWDPNAPSQNVLNDCSPCKDITNKLDKYVLRVNISNIPYRARSTNSNAFTSGALADAGLPVPTPPNNLSVPGFGTPLTVVPLPVPPTPKH